MSEAIHRVNHEIRQRRLNVLRVTDLTPRMRRVTLGGPELQGFTSLGTDDHIKLLFAETAEQQHAIDARTLNREGGERPTMREYTPRRIDLQANELDIDFVLHGDGPASTWAAQAAPGQTLDIAGPRASMVVPDIFEAYLLIGDETALPAIGRRLEALPAGRRVVALIQIHDEQERQPLPSKAQVDVMWSVRGRDDLVATVEALPLPEGTLYAWVALEKNLTRQVKALLIGKGVAQDAFKAVAYWRAEGSASDD